MLSTVGIWLAAILVFCILAYLGWQILVAIHHFEMRREAKRREESGSLSICRYGVNAAGEITRVRVAFKPREGSGRIDDADLPSFLRK
ncbi:MAG: hypothetical protein D3M94_17205 [Rhodocyclales bacterium GT-UBC]|nr:MAG: hypothetical protein D3M94_17205 [Rhodocyclales bacterium GT-UBC]